MGDCHTVALYRYLGRLKAGEAAVDEIGECGEVERALKADWRRMTGCEGKSDSERFG